MLQSQHRGLQQDTKPRITCRSLHICNFESIRPLRKHRSALTKENTNSLCTRSLATQCPGMRSHLTRRRCFLMSKPDGFTMIHLLDRQPGNLSSLELPAVYASMKRRRIWCMAPTATHYQTAKEPAEWAHPNTLNRRTWSDKKLPCRSKSSSALPLFSSSLS